MNKRSMLLVMTTSV